MPLDLTKLRKVKQRNGKIIAECPACAESGGDGQGTHLAVFEDGPFACIKFQGDKEHSRRISELVGLPIERDAPALPPPPKRAPEPLDWQANCARLADHHDALTRLAAWRGWTAEFCHAIASAGAIGLHEGRISFPVHEGSGGAVTGRHVFQWPDLAGTKAWYAPGRNVPLVIGAASLASVKQVHLAESQWDALSLLHARGWKGERLDKPFIVTRGTSINPALTTLLADVEMVTLWPQRDGPKADGKTPSEEWTQRCLALLPRSMKTVCRADTPDGFKDWNDVLRTRGAAETLALVKSASRTALPLELLALLLPQSDLSDKTPAEGNLSDLSDIDTGENEETKPFPMHTLTGSLLGMVDAAAKAALVPAELTACCALATLSASIGGGLEILSGGSRRTRANLFLMPVAASGTGKGQAYRMMAEPFLELEREGVRKWTKDTAPTARANATILEGDRKRLQNAKATDRANRLSELKRIESELDELQSSLHEPTWSTANVTQEKLVELLALSPTETLASLSPEARGVADVVAGRYHDGKSGDEAIYLSCYSGESVTVHRKSGKPAVLKRPCVTILWMLQPDAVQKIMGNANMTESGLLPRFLICNTRAEPQHEPEAWAEIPHSVSQRWKQLVYDLAGAFHDIAEPVTISTTSEAAAVMRDYRNRIVDASKTGGALHDVAIYPARWAEQAWRLAVVLHAVVHRSESGKQPLTPDIAEAAVELAEWFASQQLSLLSAGRTERKNQRLDRLKSVLSGHPKQRANMRVLQRSHGFERAEIESLSVQFPHVLRVEIERTGEAGRPPEWVSVQERG